MIADLPLYPEYRDSGVSWLGAVPDHWEVVRTRYIFREIDQRSPDGTETHLSMSQKLGLVPTSMVEQRTLVSESYAGGKLCEEDDIVLNRLKAHLGVFALAQQNGVISPDYTVLRKVRPMTVNYFEHVLKSPACRSELRVRAKGIVEGFWRLYTDDLYDIRLPVPPVAEQAAIVRFLDHADQRIRRFIATKRKLIAFLGEQKQAIVNHALTRGLDPGVRFKPSGLESLGDVPEHWEVRKLSRLTDPARKVMYGIVLPGPNVDDGVFIVKGGNCEPGRLRVELLSRTTHQIEAAYTRSRLRTGDIVFAIRGGVGAAEMVPPEVDGANLTQDAARIAAGPGVHPGWLLYSVRAPKFRAQVESRVVGATVRGINIRDLKRIYVPVPPPREQSAITSYLDATLKPIDAGRDRLSREISLVGEYRTRLVADVVTGKLDVREAAAHLPDRVGEAEPLHDTDDLAQGDESDADLDAVLEESVI